MIIYIYFLILIFIMDLVLVLADELASPPPYWRGFLSWASRGEEYWYTYLYNYIYLYNHIYIYIKIARSKVRSHRIAPRFKVWLTQGGLHTTWPHLLLLAAADCPHPLILIPSRKHVLLTERTCDRVWSRYPILVELVSHKLRWRYAEHSWSAAYQV